MSDKKKEWKDVPEGQIYAVQKHDKERDRINEIKRTEVIGDASDDGMGGM